MSAIKIGVQLFSVREELADNLEETMKKLSEMGYEGVEFFGEPPAAPEKLKELLEENNLECCGWHFWGDYIDLKDDKKLAGVLDLYKTIGNDNLIISSVPEKYRGTAEGWREIARDFNEIAVELTKHDINLGYHNHDFEFETTEGQTPWNILFDNTDPEIMMQLDTGNAYKGGGDVVEIIKQYALRAKTIHLKPYSKQKGFKTMIGEDDTPWKEIFQICQEAGNTEWYIIEYESDVYEPLVSVEKCINKTKEILN